MSISYLDDISDGSGSFIFLKLLARWKGSLYKLVWLDLLVYLFIHYLIQIIYWLVLNTSQKTFFNEVVDYCEQVRGQVPVSFLLGFFVSGVIGRWFDTYMYIPWLNNISYQIASFIMPMPAEPPATQVGLHTLLPAHCQTVRGRRIKHSRLASDASGKTVSLKEILSIQETMECQVAAINCADPRVALRARLTVMRYLNLSWILMMRTISDRISSRFRHQCLGPEGRKKQHLQHGRREMFRSSEFTPKEKRDGPSYTKKPYSSPLLLPTPSSQPTKPSSSASTLFNFNGVENGLFEAPDEYGIRETLKSFNNDKKVQQTFGKIITEAEIRAFEVIARRYFCRTRQRYLPEYWVPIQWAVRVVQKTALHGNIPDPKILIGVCSEIGKFRQQLQQLKTFSSLTMPLVYTQVAVIAVYSYFLCQILATQHTERFGNETNTTTSMSVPIFSFFYFIFLIGWLKVALCVMNPFGEDYEDFETSEILDYNLDVSYRAVLMDDVTYPEDLQRATFALRTMDGYERDNLKVFLDSVSHDLDDVEFDENANDIRNLEVRPGFLTQLKQRFCRTSEKAQIFRDEKELRTTVPNPLPY